MIWCNTIFDINRLHLFWDTLCKYFLCSFFGVFFLHKVIGYEVNLSNTNDFNKRIWLVDRILKNTTTPDQCKPGSNGNK